MNMVLSILSQDWSGLFVALIVGIIAYYLFQFSKKNSHAIIYKSLQYSAVGFGAVSLLLALGNSYHLLRTTLANSDYSPPGQMIDVGGYKMHLQCQGQANNKPTVVWIPGAHGQGLIFNHHQTRIAKEARSCIFDRPGTGWSDIGPFPRTVAGEVEELHKLLTASSEKGPFIFVGHSFGGLLAVNYPAHYPENTAGVVLFDATTPDSLIYFRDIGCPALREQPAIAGLSALFGLAWDIAPPFTVEDRKGLFSDLEDVWEPLFVNEVRPSDGFSESSIMDSACREPFKIVSGEGILGEMPLFSVTPTTDKHTFIEWTKANLHISKFEAENMYHILEGSRLRNAKLSTIGEQHYAPDGTGHYFPYEDVEFALSKVRKMLTLFDNGEHK